MKTATQIAALKLPGMHGTGTPGLYLKISPNGGKSWAYRYQLAGKRTTMGLGPYPAVSLADARRIASGHASDIARGIDPLASKRASQDAARDIRDRSAKSRTLRQAVDDYVDAKGAGWSAKHRAQWPSSIARELGDHMDRPVEDLTVAALADALLPGWSIRPESASRVLDRVALVASYAHARGWRTTGAGDWRTHARFVLPVRPASAAHHAAAPWSDIPDLWPRIVSPALRLLILTAARSGEIRNATWSEFDLAAALWTIPASRMKAGREHVVPLSTQAVDMLRPILAGKASSDLVFEGQRKGRPMHDMTLARALPVPGATVHGFRSAFRDWAAETGDYDHAAVELCLAHAVGSAVERAYRRGILLAKRREIMQAWADWTCNVQ
jgi:integrase